MLSKQLVTALAVAAGACTGAMADVVAMYDFDFNVAGSGRNTSFVAVPDNSANGGAFPATAASNFPDLFGDCDRTRSRNVADDTLLIFPNDNFGILGNFRNDRVFATNDLQNDDNLSGTATASWTFDISGFSNLGISVDLAAMGDFEATGNISSAADSWSITASIDGGPAVTLFQTVVREDLAEDYRLERSDRVINFPDPLEVNGVLLSNLLSSFTASIAGSGSSLTITLNAQSDGNDETFVLDNIIITGDSGSSDPTGECCLPGGACRIATSTNCSSVIFGSYFGDGTDCNTSPCVGPKGACCVPNGACGQTTENECGSISGTWSGAGTDCGSASCDIAPTGACCAGDGTCSVLSETDCAGQGGSYRGDFTDCGIGCPQPGACCLTDGSCAIMLPEACAAQLGEYQGAATTCETVTCTGACCLPNGTCSALTETACIAASGIYNGDGVLCGDVDCSVPTGACCLPGNLCESLSAADCAAASGTYRGDESVCAEVSCGSPIGSVEITRFDFDGNAVGGRNISFTQSPLAGSFSSLGDGFQPFQLCDNDCPSHATCSAPFSLVDDSLSCFTGDRLGVIPQNRLDRWFGINDLTNPNNLSGLGMVNFTFDVSGYTAVSISIEMQAMGDFEATGTVSSPADTYNWTVSFDGGPAVPAFTSTVREDLSHSYTMANGTTVVPIDDPLEVNGVVLTNTITVMKTGALGAGSTMTLTLAATNDGDEAYVFDNIVVRGISTGPQTGACCHADGSCTEESEDGCDSDGDSYQGNGTSCESANCPQPTGACCHADGSCTEETEEDCNSSDGAYQGNGTSCETANCPQPTGACCIDRCTCLVLTESDCGSQGGIYGGDGSTCDDATECYPNPVCPCDWNGFDGLDSQDFFDFLDGFFSGNADFNCFDGTDSQDYFDFIDCFFAPPEGCQ